MTSVERKFYRNVNALPALFDVAYVMIAVFAPYAESADAERVLVLLATRYDTSLPSVL